MSIMTHASGAGGFLLEHSTAIIKLDEDGSAQLTVSPCEMGQGILGVLGQIAAEAIGLRYEDIHVITGDTDVTLFDIGTHASRSTYAIGNAVLDAGKKVKAWSSRERAKAWESPRIRWTCATAGSSEGRPGEDRQRGRDLQRRHLRLRHRRPAHHGHRQAPGFMHCPNFQAGFAEIEVDVETGVIKVLKLVMAHDIGRAINPLTVEACLEGGAYQGLGYALTEDLVIDEKTGKVLTDSFATYKMLSTLDMPEVEVILVEEPDPTRPVRSQGRGRDRHHQCRAVHRERPLRRGRRQDPFATDDAREGAGGPTKPEDVTGFQ